MGRLLLPAFLLLPLLASTSAAAAAGAHPHNNTDGTPGQEAAAWSAARAGGSEQDLLKWALTHSDPDELRRAAAEARLAADAGDPEFTERRERVQALMEQMKEEPTEAELMQEAIGILSNASATRQQLGNALEALRYLCEPIDNANNLQGMGGLPPLVALLSSATPPALQSRAAYVLGTAAANNQAFQGQLLGDHPEVLQLLLALVARADAGASDGGVGSSSGTAGGEGQTAAAVAAAHAEVQAEAGIKALYCLSAILRLNAPARAAFYQAAGVHTLQQLLGSRGTGVRTKRRALSLLTDLIELDAPAMSAAAPAMAAAAQHKSGSSGSGSSGSGSGSGTPSPSAAALDYSAAVAAALQLLDVEQQPLVGSDMDLQEKALLALLALLDGSSSSGGRGSGRAEGTLEEDGGAGFAGGSAAAELIADAGGLATLRTLCARLEVMAAAEREMGEDSYARELVGLVRQVQRHVAGAGSAAAAGAAVRDEL